MNLKGRNFLTLKDFTKEDEKHNGFLSSFCYLQIPNVCRLPCGNPGIAISRLRFPSRLCLHEIYIEKGE